MRNDRKIIWVDDDENAPAWARPNYWAEYHPGTPAEEARRKKRIERLFQAMRHPDWKYQDKHHCKHTSGYHSCHRKTKHNKK